MKSFVIASTATILLVALAASNTLQAQTTSAGKLVPIIASILLDDQNVAHSTGHLNDTGVDWSGRYPSGNNNLLADCFQDVNTPWQDCNVGRDASNNNDSNGHAGFYFIKLDAGGSELPVSATSWSCVADRVTGLIWEVKKDNNGMQKDSLHDADDEFAWFNIDNSSNGGDAGSNGAGQDSCFAYTPGVARQFCNTEAFTARVNIEGLCGKRNWRLPSIGELMGIADFSRTHSKSETNYFPNTTPAWTNGFYRSSSPVGTSATSILSF